MRRRRRITVSFSDEEYNQLKNIADKNNVSMSETARRYVDSGLNGTLSSENIDFISKIVREQLRVVLQPQVDRLASLTAKTCIQASTAAYLTAETIARFVPEDYQEDVLTVYEQARKKGVSYTRQKNEESYGD